MNEDFKPKVRYAYATKRCANLDFALVTIVCDFHRLILPQILTHSSFSRNASSSRARGIKQSYQTISESPAMPVHYGKNVKGSMSATEEIPLSSKGTAEALILKLRDHAVSTAQQLELLGVHKQVANRYLEPWGTQTMVITGQAFQFQDFLALRIEDAQPEHMELAQAIKAAVEPVVETAEMREGFYDPVTDRTYQHTPFVEDLSRTTFSDAEYIQVSIGRAAGVSYKDPTDVSPEQAMKITSYLAEEGHNSPFEHIASHAKGWNYKKLLWRDYRACRWPHRYEQFHRPVEFATESD